MPHRSERSVNKKLGAVFLGRRNELALVTNAVQAQHDVDVQSPSALVLRDLHVGRAHTQLALLAARQPGELTRHLVGRLPPQLGDECIPEDRVLVVEALSADRLAQPRVVLIMDLVARERHAMPADLSATTRPAPARLTVDHAARVHRPEPGRGQREEDRRMRGDGFGHALASANPGHHELKGIAAIGLRARWADRLTAVAAARQERLVRLALCAEDGAHLAGLHVDRVDASAQPHRPPAVASRPQLPLEALPLIRISGSREYTFKHRPCGHRRHEDTSSSSHSSVRRAAPREAMVAIASSSR
jgi:hypothetical protein